MQSLLKRLGAVGAGLLLLNEIRGLLMVGALLNSWAQSADAHPHLGAVARLIAFGGGLAC